MQLLHEERKQQLNQSLNGQSSFVYDLSAQDAHTCDTSWRAERRRMNAEDFRRIALTLPGAEEGSHMGSPDFRVGGRIFATLAAQDQGYGNLMLTAEQQAAFVDEAPDIFIPVPGGWGRMGATHIKLAAASEEVVAGALRTAWKLRTEKNSLTRRKQTSGPERTLPGKRGRRRP